MQSAIRSGGCQGGGEMGPGPSQEAGHIEDRGPGSLCLPHQVRGRKVAGECYLVKCVVKYNLTLLKTYIFCCSFKNLVYQRTEDF
jgi:hypothetical protein